MAEAPALCIERRQHRRFAITLELHYVVANSQGGQGRVLDMSSGGLLFQCGAALPAGKRIQAIINWPFLLNGDCPLRLYIQGRTIRSDQRGTAMSIGRYEFRTAPRPKGAGVGSLHNAYTEDREGTWAAASGR